MFDVVLFVAISQFLLTLLFFFQCLYTSNPDIALWVERPELRGRQDTNRQQR